MRRRLLYVLAVLCLPTLSFAQVTSTRIRDGVQPGEADVVGSEPSGSAQGLVVRPVTPTTAWPVNAAQSGSWTVQQGSPPWSVSQSGSWTVQQGTPPWVIRLRDASGTDLATVGADGSLKVDNSSHLQPVKLTDGTNDVKVDQLSVEPVDTDYGTTARAIIHGHTTAGGGSYVAVKVSPSGALEVEPSGTVTVAGTVTANQGGAPWSIRLQDASGSTQVVVTGAGALKVDGSAVTQPVSIAGTLAVNLSQVGGNSVATLGSGEQKVAAEGLAASGATKSGNPVQIGGVFNTTQPTVTTGQAVEAQATARGALIVASGVDAIAVNNTQQGTAAQNLAQVNGNTVNTGTGAAGSGTARVAVANDSKVQVWDGTNTAAVNASSQLAVNCANCSGSGVSQQDKTAFTAGSSNMVPIGGYLDDTSPSTLAEGEAGAARLTTNRALHVNLRDASGNEVTPGGGTQYDQGTATTATDKLSMAGAVRHDTATVDGGVADGDRVVLSTDSVGRLRTTASDTTQPVSQSGTWSTRTQDGAGNAIDSATSQPAGTERGLITRPASVAPDVTASGSITANGQNVALAVWGLSSASVNLTGSWTGTLVPDLSLDGGTTWVQGVFLDYYSGVYAGNSTSVNTTLLIQITGGTTHVRVRSTAWTSGTATVGLRATAQATNPLALAAKLDSPANAVAVGIGGYDYNPNFHAVEMLNFEPNAATDYGLVTRPASVPPLKKTTLSVWNSGTSVNATQTIFTNSGSGAVLVHLVQSSGTFSAGAITFEVTYDNSNWVTIPADAVLDPASTTFAQISLPYTLVTSTNKPFLLMGKGWQGLRIKLSTAITGTGTVTPNYALLSNEPAKTVIALSPTAANFAVTTTPPSNASTNVAQFGGTNVSTGTGAGGAGIPRVTISNDSSLAANQSVNVNQVGGSSVQTASNGLNSTGGGVQATALVGQLDDTTPNTCTENQFCHARISSKGVLYQQLRDAAGNERGANVNASNQLSVSVDNANVSMNLAQLAGNTISSGNGASGTGTIRVSVANDSTGIIQEVPGTSGGLSINRTVAAASTNATNVKASAGQVYQIIASNVSASARFVHLYNTSGTPTCNSSIIATFIVPGNSSGAGTNIPLNPGWAFGTGIGFCITTANDGTGSVSASDVVLMIGYK